MARKKYSSNTFRLLLLVLLGALFILPFILSAFVSLPNERALYQSKAASSGKTITVSGLTGEAIQQAVNSAKDGDTIMFPPGNYQGPTAIPMGLGDAIFISESRGGAATCFVRIEKKTITLKGQNLGSILYGEGHSQDKANVMPYQTRGGVCVLNGANVTFDGIRVKEFQKRCIVVYNSTIIVKNSQIEGCDEGGASLLGNSSGLFVNNNIYSVNFGGIMLWQNSQAKVVNNTFYGAHIMFFFHPGTPDTANAELINNIFGNGTKITQVDWWKGEAAKLQNIKASHNLFDKPDCNPDLDYCKDFPGKIIGDPLFTAPVIFMGGAEAWSNMTLKEGSPALNAGDPNIPGPPNIGVTGGPCADPASSICSSYIQNNVPKPYEEPTPTPVPQQQIPDTSQSNSNADNQTVGQLPQSGDNGGTHYVTNQVGPQPNVMTNDVFSLEQGVIYIENIGKNKTIKLKALYLQNANQNVTGELSSGQSIKYSFSSLCNGTSLRATGALVYSSSEDNGQSIRYKNLDLDCYKTQVIDIE